MMKKTIHLIICIFIINITVAFFALPVFSEETNTESTQNTEKEPYSLDEEAAAVKLPSFDAKKSLIRMTVSLVIILGIIFLLAALYKKFFSSSFPLQKGKGLMRIIERMPLSPKNHLMLVWVIDRMVLLSSNNGAITKIMEIKDKSVTNELPEDIFQDSLQREIAENPIEEVANA